MSRAIILTNPRIAKKYSTRSKSSMWDGPMFSGNSFLDTHAEVKSFIVPARRYLQFKLCDLGAKDSGICQGEIELNFRASSESY